MSKLFFIAVVLVFFTACQDPMESVAEVTKLRIIAIQAEPPEIEPINTDTDAGDPGFVTLTALIADPYDEDKHDNSVENREVQVAWFAFGGLLSPTSELEITSLVPYAVFDETVDVHIISKDPTDTSAHAHFADDYAEDRHIVPLRPDLPEIETVSVFALICAGGPTIKGFEGLPSFDSSTNIADILEGLCEGGDSILATKTFEIRTSTENPDPPNANPQLDKLTFNEKCLTPIGSVTTDDSCETHGCFECEGGDGCRGEEVSLEAKVIQSSVQDYHTEQLGEVEATTERLYISWFSTGGFFGSSKTGFTDETDFTSDNTWSPPTGGESNTNTMFVVARDVRGGVSWEVFPVNAWDPDTAPKTICPPEKN